MGINLIPPEIQEKYELHEWKHACAILAQDFPGEWFVVFYNYFYVFVFFV